MRTYIKRLVQRLVFSEDLVILFFLETGIFFLKNVFWSDNLEVYLEILFWGGGGGGNGEVDTGIYRFRGCRDRVREV